MVVLRGQSLQMYNCRVLYIGSAPPIETLKGTDALQKPLRERYPANLKDVEGIDATLTVLPDCLEMTYTASGQVVQFPLDRLNICAAMRAITALDGTTGEKSRQFVPVNTTDSDSKQPAIFSAIIRRSQGRQIAECHAFICNSTRDALHLVNSTATANMALKQQKGQKAHVNGNSYDDGVPVVHSMPNGYVSANGGRHVETIVIGDSGEHTQGYRQTSNEPIYVKTSVDQNNSYNYPAQQQNTSEDQTIYITFDKTNLVSKDASTSALQVQSSYGEGYQPRSVAVERTNYVDVPSQNQVVVQAPRYVVPAPLPPPPPVLYARPPVARSRIYAPPPQPVILRSPPPMVVRPEPSPIMMVRQQPQRMYARRVMSPPARYLAPPPNYYRRRTRSSSPVYSREANSEMKMSRISNNEKYQRKWKGPSSDIIEYRTSRRDIHDNLGPPRDFRRAENQFLNERAFSRRMNADNRISRATTPYHYPTAYDLHDAMLYTRPITKSNPRYSSSSSDSDEETKDNRFSKSKR